MARRTRVDLRLAPAALAAWLAAALLVALPAGQVWLLGALATAGAGAGGLLALRRSRRSSRNGSDGVAGVGSGGGQLGHLPGGWSTGWSAGSSGSARRGPPERALGQAVLVLITTAVVALAGAAQLEARGSGLLAALVEQHATARVVGTVRSEPTPLAQPEGWSAGSERVRFELDVEHVTGRGQSGEAAAPVLLLGGPGWAEVAYGARVEASGTFAPTAPGDDLIGLFVVRGESRSLDPPGATDRVVGRIWADLLRVTDGLADDPRGLVPGIAVGDTSRLPPDLDDAMRVAGLTHVTAVSGAHFAIIGASVLGLTSVAGLPRRARIVVVAAAMVGVVLLVRAEPSVLRAALMGAVGIGAMLLGRPSRALPALGATVIALLVMDPWLARSFGFVLSVLATAGIVTLSEPIARSIGRVIGWAIGRAVPKWLGYAVAVPIAAQAVCAPVVVLLNPSLATYGVPANLAVAPALAPATVLGVLTALVAPWWPAGGYALAMLAGWAATWIAGVARAVASLPAAQLPWPGGPGGAAALAVVTVAAGFALLRYRGRNG